MTMLADRFVQGAFRHVPEAPSFRRSWAAAAAAFDSIVATLLDWQECARQRRQLLSLDTAALKDFGRSRADAAGEGEKPFWRV